MRPVTAITIFLPTDESHNSRRRVMTRSHVYHGLGGADGLRRFLQLFLLTLVERHLDDALEPRPPQLAWHSTEHIFQAEFTLQPGRTRQDTLLVQGNRLDHLDSSCARRVVGRPCLQK